MSSYGDYLRLLKAQLHRPPLRFRTGMWHSVHPDRPTRFHSHAEMEAVFHPTGAGVTQLSRRRKIEFKEGSVVIYGPREIHDQTMHRPGEDLCLQWVVPAALVPKGCLYLPRLEVPHLIAEFQALARGHVGVSDLQQALLDARATSILLHLLHLTLTAAQAEQSPPGEEPVRQAEQFLRSEFQSLRSLREVAGHVGLSSNHLRHLFKKNRGISMVAYLNQVRMERARSLLTQSRLPLKQVARLCGFADEYYFSAVFRRHNHIAPGQYRQRK